MIDTIRFCVGKTLRKMVVTRTYTRFRKAMFYLAKPIEWVAELIAPTVEYGDDYVIFRTSRNIKQEQDSSSTLLTTRVEHVCDLPMKLDGIKANKLFIERKNINVIGPEGRAAGELWINEKKRAAKVLPNPEENK